MKRERWARTKQDTPVAITDSYGPIERSSRSARGQVGLTESGCLSCGAPLTVGLTCPKCIRGSHSQRKKKR